MATPNMRPIRNPEKKPSAAAVEPDVTLAKICPFSGGLLTLVPGPGVRFKGFGFYTKVFASLAEAGRTLSQRDSAREKTPATVYLKRCPWTGQELELEASDHGFRWIGPFWASQYFKKREHAHHWFSIRGGTKPIFGPDAVGLITAPKTDGQEAAAEAAQMIEDGKQDAEESLG